MTHLLRRARVVGLLAGLALWPCATLLAQDYEIRLHRPEKVGNKSRETAAIHVVEKRTITTQGKVLKDDAKDTTIECASVVTVLEVDAKGQAAKVSLAIDKCTQTENGVKSDVVAKGSVAVMYEKGNQTVVEINGMQAAPDVQDALSHVVSLNAGMPTDDEAIGTTERKKPGDHWTGNAELISKELQRKGVIVNKEDISSTFTLEKVVKAAGMDCLQVSGEVNIKKMDVNAMPGATVEKASIQIRFSGKVPVDTTKRDDPESSMEMTTAFIVKGKFDPNAPEMTIEASQKVTDTSSSTPIE